MAGTLRAQVAAKPGTDGEGKYQAQHHRQLEGGWQAEVPVRAIKTPSTSDALASTTAPTPIRVYIVARKGVLVLK
jgi:hypothetical protein